MSEIKRLRIFAGPNGSGKSTLFNAFEKMIHPVLSVNSDVLEQELARTGMIDLTQYEINASQIEFERYCRTDAAVSLIKKAESAGFKIDLVIKENVLVDRSKETHSYEASLATSFIREKLYECNKSFSFETVMSHRSKVTEIKDAKKQGYRVYLYFICLDNPNLNIARVEDRVEKGGHPVAPEKVLDRYSKTLRNLLPAIRLANRAYLFDNSNEMRLIAEVEDMKITICEDEARLPNWFIQYVVNLL